MVNWVNLVGASVAAAEISIYSGCVVPVSGKLAKMQDLGFVLGVLHFR
jgi:hypothetical protein